MMLLPHTVSGVLSLQQVQLADGQSRQPRVVTTFFAPTKSATKCYSTLEVPLLTGKDWLGQRCSENTEDEL